MALAIVLAVYMPPQAPAPGHAAADDFAALFFGDLAGDEFAVGLKGGDDVELADRRGVQPARIVPP